LFDHKIWYGSDKMRQVFISLYAPYSQVHPMVRKIWYFCTSA